MSRGDPAHIAAVQAGKRKAALYRITDPLWQAIASQNGPEIVRLQRALIELVLKDREKRES